MRNRELFLTWYAGILLCIEAVSAAALNPDSPTSASADAAKHSPGVVGVIERSPLFIGGWYVYFLVFHIVTFLVC